MQVIGTGHDIALMRLKPLMVLGRDPEAQNVDGLRLLGKPRCQLFRYEDPRLVRDLEYAGDRVVVGDRHEIHAPPLGQFIDLSWRGRALGKRYGALDLEPREFGRPGVTVKVRPRGGPSGRRDMFGAGTRLGGDGSVIVHATRLGRAGANPVTRTSMSGEDAVKRPRLGRPTATDELRAND